MPKFLTREEVFEMIGRELPEDVYAEGPATAFFTKADDGALSVVVESAYANLQKIYNNYFPQTSSERLTDWEIKVFGETQSSTLTSAERKSRILAQLQSALTMSIPSLIKIVKGVIGNDKEIEIVEWGCDEGSWFLDESMLDIETILSGSLTLIFGQGMDPCTVTAEMLGVSQEDLDFTKQEAYTYEVRVFQYTMTTDERERLDKQLSIYEPARSGHVIVDGLTEDDEIEDDVNDGD